MGKVGYNSFIEKYKTMRIISKAALRDFWGTHPDAEQPLRAWHSEAKSAAWKTPVDVKDKYRSASILGDNRVVFNIGGNKYRLVVKINYSFQIIYVRFVGTHKEYDDINAEEI
jgi:mRNA interferase HigB